MVGSHLGRVRLNPVVYKLTCACVLPFSAAQLLSYPGKNKIPLNYHIVEVRSCLALLNAAKYFQRVHHGNVLFSGDLWRTFPAAVST